MWRVGLTGGIGCGKSSVGERFAAFGVPVWDADRIARGLLAPGSDLLGDIAARYGSRVMVEGVVDRQRLRQVVFAAPEERAWLEALLHPQVYRELDRQATESLSVYGILMVPLLLETGQRGLVQRLLVVDCPPDLQRARVKARDGLSDTEIDRILAAQLSREQRLAEADDIVLNDGSLDELDRQVAELHRRYLMMSEREASPRERVD